MGRLARAFMIAVCVHLSAASPVLAQQAANERQLQAFHLAVKANDFSFIARMEGLGLGPNTRDALGNNLLMLAIRDEGPQMALIMLDQAQWRTPEVLAHENQIGENALMLSALKGSVAVAKRLLDAGAEVNREGWSALHYAATSGHLEMIVLLLDQHAYVDSESPSKTTPLMMASRFNKTEAAKLLLQHGADPTLVNDAGFTARSYAVEGNNRDLAFLLELEEISFRNRKMNAEVNVDSSAPLIEMIINAGSSVVIEGQRVEDVRALTRGKEATTPAGTEVFGDIR